MMTISLVRLCMYLSSRHEIMSQFAFELFVRVRVYIHTQHRRHIHIFLKKSQKCAIKQSAVVTLPIVQYF